MIMKPLNRTPSSKELRSFGLTILVGFGLIAALLAWRGRIQRAEVVIGISGSVGLLALIVPQAARPFYWAWMGFGLVMGSIMSRVILSLIFYGVLTPLALVFRVMGRDALKRRARAPKGESYWVEHPAITDKRDYEHLF